MRALLLSVKDLRNAKKRLMGVLTPEERFALAEVMLADTIRAVRGVRRAEKIFVITNYEPAMRLAEENRWEILREEHQISESDSVDAASRVCELRGVTGLLRIPLDVPLVQASDVDDESDLRALLKNDLSSTETGQWLRESGVEARLRQHLKAEAKGA